MRRTLMLLLYAASFAGVALLAWRGRDYYALPLVARPRHPLHWELKPGGEIGLWLGIVGLALMVLMLLYSVRKRLPLLRRAGDLRTWLDLHIWCGIIGPLLIFLHSALKVGGLIAISFWSMVAVATSGIIGRFLYAQIPRTAAGDELSLDEARRFEAELAATLRFEFELSDADFATLALGADSESSDGASLAAALAALALAPWRFRRRLAAFRRRHPEVGGRALARLGRQARQRELLRARLGLWRRLHELFHYWHVFHKPFAVLMYLFAAIHVGVAWVTGYAGGHG